MLKTGLLQLCEVMSLCFVDIEFVYFELVLPDGKAVFCRATYVSSQLFLEFHGSSVSNLCPGWLAR